MKLILLIFAIDCILFGTIRLAVGKKKQEIKTKFLLSILFYFYIILFLFTFLLEIIPKYLYKHIFFHFWPIL